MVCNLIDGTMKRKVIYVYKKNYIEDEGFLKIGDTSIDRPDEDLRDNSEYLISIAEDRIRKYEASSPIEILYVTVAVTNDWKCFRDYDVHEVLQRSNYKKITRGKSTEWFKIDLDIAKAAIKAVKEGKDCLDNTNNIIIKETNNDIIFRPEQKEAIDKTIKLFKSKKNNKKMLWNAKMRFGKTLCALELVRKQQYKKVLILTHRPGVCESWYNEYVKILSGSGYLFGSKSFQNKIDYLKKCNKPYIYFASIQKTRNGADDNEKVLSIDWDFVIIDEAHEGTQTELAESMFDRVLKEDTKVLYLSGTPFNLMDDYDETQIFSWDYVREQESKVNWDLSHYGDSNPYLSLPKMHMFTYKLSEHIKNNLFLDISTKAFNFAEFFKTDASNKFVYEEEVRTFLDLLSLGKGGNGKDTNMPFSTELYRNELRHTLWTMPSRKSASALAELLKEHSYFKKYNVANLVEDGITSSDLDLIRGAITKNPEESYSITLTVRRGTVGITVKEWTGILVLNNTESASNYLQSIFRVQSPYSNKNGYKEKCYVFDFAPDRTLKMIAEASNLSKKNKIIGTPEQERNMARLLNFLPIISIDGNIMAEYSVKKMLRQLKRALAEKAVKNGFDDMSIYNDKLFLELDELDITNFKALEKIVGKTKQTKSKKNIKINNQGLDSEERERLNDIDKKKNLDDKDKELLARLEKLNKQKKDLISVLRAISIRIPLMIYGIDSNIDEEITLAKFIKLIDDISWNEFMPRGVSKKIFNDFKKYYDEDIFIEASYKIRNTCLAANKLSYEERIEKITTLLSSFKNPDKETVLTPWRVVNMHLGEMIGGYNFFDEDYINPLDECTDGRFIDRGSITSKAFDKDSIILEINSKTGIYPLYMAYTIYKKRWYVESQQWNKGDWIYKDKELWKEVLTKNIFVICKSKMAKTITYRTLYGYETNHAIDKNIVYFENLVLRLKENFDLTLNEIKKEYGGDNMKFDVVIGNPPYQEVVKEATNGNNANTVDIYQYFQKAALKLGKVNSLIYPAKDLQRGKMNLMDKRLIKVQIYNGSSKESEQNIPGGRTVFESVRRIPGDVGIFLWDTENTTELINYQGVDISRTDKIMPVRKELLELAFKLEKYIKTFKPVSIRKCCESSFVEKNQDSVLGEVENRGKEVPNGYTKVITNNKAGSGGKARWYYIKTDDLDYIQPDVYKVVIGSAYPIENFRRGNDMDLLDKNEMFGRTKICLYSSDKKIDAENFKKFASTTFARLVISITPLAMFYYMPNFDDIKDCINWSRSIEQIDDDLFNMFELKKEKYTNLL